MKKKIELGITSFGETTPIESTNRALSHFERIQNMVEEIELADKVGLDIYAIGEHHREDFAVSIPEMVLAAGAVNTKNIRLSSAVSVLSSSDPIRLYQNYATLDALSNGRAEIMVWKGSFIESFPLFGFDLEDYYELFEEKLAMLLQIRESELLNWEWGKFTHKVQGKWVYPRSVQEKLPITIATGGSYETVVKTAQMGLPIAFAVIWGNPMGFKGLIDVYRNVWAEAWFSAEQLQVATHSWGFIAEDNQDAIDQYFFPTKTLVDTIAKERSHRSPMSREQYLYSIGEHGAMFVGDPDRVAAKIINFIEQLGVDRFMLHIPIGSMPHSAVLKAIELYGSKVAPQVRAYFQS